MGAGSSRLPLDPSQNRADFVKSKLNLGVGAQTARTLTNVFQYKRKNGEFNMFIQMRRYLDGDRAEPLGRALGMR